MLILLKKCDYENKQLIILGDMNCDYSKNFPESHTKKIEVYILCIPVRTTNSRTNEGITKTSAHQIDLLFTNDTRNIAQSGVIHTGLLDHKRVPNYLCIFQNKVFSAKIGQSAKNCGRQIYFIENRRERGQKCSPDKRGTYSINERQ